MMGIEELDEWAEAFVAFQARFAGLFTRREPREQMGKYLHGLVAPLERKTSWQLAEGVADHTPDRMQRLLYRVDWDADAARDRLMQFTIETFGAPDGIGVVDETGFLKKGTASVGVQRQYSGTAGKVENCQMATVLTYTSQRGHVFLDRRLYLPESWCTDPLRRAAAQIPETVTFQTKPQQALAMLEHAWAQGVPMRWVTGDEAYGDAPYLRAAIAASGRSYVLAVACTTPVWTTRPVVAIPPYRGRGPRPTIAHLAPDAPAARTVAAVVASWPATQWQRFAVADGEKGPRVYDWGCARVIESADQVPRNDVWLLARRSVTHPTELAYYLAEAPLETPVTQLAAVAASRYTVEQCIEEGKGEVGLDQYEVRLWHSWYRHVTLAMMAHAWLAVIRAAATAKKGACQRTWRT